jgi:hypothetical protein
MASSGNLVCPPSSRVPCAQPCAASPDRIEPGIPCAFGSSRVAVKPSFPTPIVLRAGRLLFTTCVALFGVSAIQARAQEPASSQSRTLLAVFAHPDDEASVGPLLARYAREPRTRVVLAIVTNGDRGVTPFGGIPAGDQLAAARVKEAACACEALGTRPPILLGLPDAGLNSSQVLADAAAKLRKVFAEVGPDAIVTWGPDGGYGHPDHRRSVRSSRSSCRQAKPRRACITLACRRVVSTPPR